MHRNSDEDLLVCQKPQDRPSKVFKSYQRSQRDTFEITAKLKPRKDRYGHQKWLI